MLRRSWPADPPPGEAWRQPKLNAFSSSVSGEVGPSSVPCESRTKTANPPCS